MPNQDRLYDLAIIGGGINGCGIARDAAGRGLQVLLCERNDLASATSSASTKLIHGGLRYLEHYNFRMVRESLLERECLLRMAPHIIWPMRFILPHMAGMRPWWLMRMGLLFYDYLGRRQLLPPTKILNLYTDLAGKDLANRVKYGFEYSDCWVDDARLVVLNAVAAREHGADILTHTQVTSATASSDGWTLELDNGDRPAVRARILVNATGPWASKMRSNLLGHVHVATPDLRLVQGSHIVVPRLFEHNRGFILQNDDLRIIFALPYLDKYTLVGTTDHEYDGDPAQVSISLTETNYLLDVINRYFRTSIKAADIVWSFSGVRGLFDDKASDAQDVNRDYVIKVDAKPAPLINVFGGKLTIYRCLAETVLENCKQWCPGLADAWTANKPLPGGDFPVDGIAALSASLYQSCTGLGEETALRLARAYGTRAANILAGATNVVELGEDFGAGLRAAEVRYLIGNEWAHDAEDILWRRTKLGLELTKNQHKKLATWIKSQVPTHANESGAKS